MRYDHHNYAKWGVIYLAEMHQLPAQVEEFKRGNFVVKRSNAKFNQVSPDQAQEWLVVMYRHAKSTSTRAFLAAWMSRGIGGIAWILG